MVPDKLWVWGDTAISESRGDIYCLLCFTNIPKRRKKESIKESINPVAEKIR
jgi:hypothetical protein